MAQAQGDTVLVDVLDILRDVLMYPAEMISILNQIGYVPQSANQSGTGKIGYFTDIYNQEGLFGFTRGLLCFIMMHYLYAFVWATANKRAVSPLVKIYGEEAVASDYPSQANLEIRLTRMFIRESAAVIATQPVHVLQTRQVAQFVGKETRYSTFLFGLFQTYIQNGLCGYFYGLIPRLLAMTIINGIMETADWLYDCYLESLERNPSTQESTFKHFVITHQQESRNFNRRISRVIGLIVTGNLDKVTTNLEIDDSGLEADENESRPKYKSWFSFCVHIICRSSKRNEKNLKKEE